MEKIRRFIRLALATVASWLGKAWEFIDKAIAAFLSWFENKAFAFAFALAVSACAYFGADPEPFVPDENVYLLAFLTGTLTIAVLLIGSCIVTKKGYAFYSLAWGVVGSAVGVLAAKLIEKYVLLGVM